MNATNDSAKQPAAASGPVRRIASVVIVSSALFLLLWLMAYSVVTSLLLSAGFGVVVAGASAVSDVVEIVVDTIATIIFGVLGAIAALFAAILSVLGW